MTRKLHNCQDVQLSNYFCKLAISFFSFSVFINLNSIRFVEEECFISLFILVLVQENIGQNRLLQRKIDISFKNVNLLIQSANLLIL